MFDNENKEIDINNLRATDLHYNTDVSMPGPVTFDEEMRFQKDIAVKMAKKSKKHSNLDDQEKEGLSNLKEKTKNEEVICFNTDKSGRWSIDSKENYKLAVEKHFVSGVREITCKEHDKLENYLNCHMLALLRMMGTNDGRNGDRIRIASTPSGCVIAPFYALRKDHKNVEIGKEAEGPKTRGVCGARDCLTMRLSHVLSMILKELVPHNDTHCDSTEDLLAEIETLNNTAEVNPRWKVGSLDIEALYPSLDISKCAEIITKELYEGEITIKNIEWKEVMLYLRYMWDDNKLRSKDLWEYTPMRRNARGRLPTFISSGSDLRKEERFKSWIFSEVEPDDGTKKWMFALAIGVLVYETITNHGYQYDSKIYKQRGRWGDRIGTGRSSRKSLYVLVGQTTDSKDIG